MQTPSANYCRDLLRNGFRRVGHVLIFDHTVSQTAKLCRRGRREYPRRLRQPRKAIAQGWVRLDVLAPLAKNQGFCFCPIFLTSLQRISENFRRNKIEYGFKKCMYRTSLFIIFNCYKLSTLLCIIQRKDKFRLLS